MLKTTHVQDGGVPLGLSIFEAEARAAQVLQCCCGLLDPVDQFAKRDVIAHIPPAGALPCREVPCPVLAGQIGWFRPAA